MSAEYVETVRAETAHDIAMGGYFDEEHWWDHQDDIGDELAERGL